MLMTINVNKDYGQLRVKIPATLSTESIAPCFSGPSVHRSLCIVFLTKTCHQQDANFEPLATVIRVIKPIKTSSSKMKLQTCLREV